MNQITECIKKIKGIIEDVLWKARLLMLFFIGIIEDLLGNYVFQNCILILINLILFLIFPIPSLISKYFETHIKITVTDGIAISTVFVLACGVIYYAGMYRSRCDMYNINSSPKLGDSLRMMGLKFIITILLGFIISEVVQPYVNNPFFWVKFGLFIFGLVISFLKYKKLISEPEFFYLAIFIAIIIVVITTIYFPNIADYITIIFLLFYLFGYWAEKNNSTENFYFSLEMIKSEKEIEEIPKLKLFDSTDIDYRFKDEKGKEIIVPIGQVHKITYKGPETRKQ